jgi:DNA-binding response OmpR family regulator
MSLRILVADDEQLASQLLMEYLNEEGYANVAVEHTPEGTVEYIEKNKPDLVFLDINFNVKMTGFDVFHQVHRTTPQTRVCMMSGYRDDCRDDVRELDVIGFVGKPSAIDAYLNVIHTFERSLKAGKKGR